jgi:hypothetical protein
MPLHFAPARGLVYQLGLVAGARVRTPHLMWRTAQARFRSRATLSRKTELARRNDAFISLYRPSVRRSGLGEGGIGAEAVTLLLVTIWRVHRF